MMLIYVDDVFGEIVRCRRFPFKQKKRSKRQNPSTFLRSNQATWECIFQYISPSTSSNQHQPASTIIWLVVWVPFFEFSQKYWEFLMIPMDELIFFRGVAQPPTRSCTKILFVIFNKSISSEILLEPPRGGRREFR